MEFKNYPLKPGQFVDEAQKKSLIVLHHTVGGTGKSSVDYWNSDAQRVGVPFVIERDGTILQTFPEDRWGFHVGSKVGNEIDRRSIGIEIASEGGLIESAGGLYCFGVVSPRTKYTGPVFDTKSINLPNYRGFRYFASYTEAQVNATIKLVNYLCEKYGIPKTLPDSLLDFKPEYYRHHGICGHLHLRADKSDVHPGFPWDALK